MFLKEKKNWRAKSVQNFNDHEIKEEEDNKKTYEELKRVCVWKRVCELRERIANIVYRIILKKRIKTGGQ